MKKHPGFTIIEILVVIAIIGALAAIGVPAYQNYVIKARVTEALEFADAARTPVMLDEIGGNNLKDQRDLLGVSKNTPVDQMTGLTWNPGKTPDMKGYILAVMNLLDDKNRAVLALEYMANGEWHCVSAKNHIEPGQSFLDEKYLPNLCKPGNGPLSRPANLPPGCPADQEMVTLPTGPACTAKCPLGQVRDPANPSQCKDQVCGPDERKNGSGVCVHVGAPPNCEPTGDPHIAYSADNTPSWMCFPKCQPGNMRDPHNWYSCIPDPKAAAPATPPAAKATPTQAPPPPKPQPLTDRPTIQCHVCDPNVPELCEQITVVQTCNYPDNFCVTRVDAHADGSKEVVRRCGNQNDAVVEWWHGTSDDDKCRDMIDKSSTFEFRCTFACEKDNCNQTGGSLRPPLETLWQDK